MQVRLPGGRSINLSLEGGVYLEEERRQLDRQKDLCEQKHGSEKPEPEERFCEEYVKTVTTLLRGAYSKNTRWVDKQPTVY